MKKLLFISILSTCSFSTVAFAGGMGEPTDCCSAFLAVEGGYAWNNITGYDFSIIGANGRFISTESNDPYAARISAGVINMLNSEIAITGEFGWGYYGKTTQNPEPSGLVTQLPATLSISQTLDGFDTLVGIAYVQDFYSLSLKAGALIQNIRTDSSANFNPFGFAVFNTLNVKTIKTAALPEIKVGAAYNFNPNWAITAAYMLAVGGSPQTTGTFDITTGAASLTINTENPTLNVFMAGIQYTA